MLTKKGSGHKEKRRTAIRREESVRDYLEQPYARILIPEADGSFSAELLEFPGCYAEGETADQAYRNLEAAANSWIAVALAQGQDIPPPSANHGYSGRIVLRLPRDLHRLAARKAQRDGVSLNQCLVTAVAPWVGADNLLQRMADRFQPNLVQETFHTALGRLVPDVEYPQAFVLPVAFPCSPNLAPGLSAVTPVMGWQSLSASPGRGNPTPRIDRPKQGPSQQIDTV